MWTLLVLLYLGPYTYGMRVTADRAYVLPAANAAACEVLAGAVVTTIKAELGPIEGRVWTACVSFDVPDAPTEAR